MHHNTMREVTLNMDIRYSRGHLCTERRGYSFQKNNQGFRTTSTHREHTGQSGIPCFQETRSYRTRIIFHTKTIILQQHIKFFCLSKKSSQNEIVRQADHTHLSRFCFRCSCLSSLCRLLNSSSPFPLSSSCS